MVNAIKRFEVWESSVEGGCYRIQVLFHGEQVEEFVRPTMKEARDAFEAAGYDRVGALDTGALVAVLPETDFAGARVAAHRLSTDLAIRSAGTQVRNWLSGVAEFPADGEDASALIDSAMARAHR